VETRTDVEVVVWRADGRAVATVPGAERLVVARDDERALARVVDEVSARVGAAVAVLRLTSSSLHVELLGEPPVPLAWQASSSGRGLGGAPWCRPGWFGAVGGRIAAALADAGLDASSGVTCRQVKHWSISAIVAAESGAGTFWWKQVPPFMAHEGRLLRWLAERRPGQVPEVIAQGEDWMLCRAFPEAADGDGPGVEDSPYGWMAEVQVGAAGSVDELLALGCPDRRLPELIDDLAALVDRRDLLGDDALRRRLADALPHVERLASELADGPVPAASLVHGDLHAGNWLRRTDGGGWFVFDWTDGCVAHPYLDLGVLPTEDGPARTARLEVYLASWRDAVGDAAAIDRLVPLALPLARAFQAVSYQRIADGVAVDRDDDGGDGVSSTWRPIAGRFVERLLDDLDRG
jgi:hypothetical protein